MRCRECEHAEAELVWKSIPENTDTEAHMKTHIYTHTVVYKKRKEKKDQSICITARNK